MKAELKIKTLSRKGRLLLHERADLGEALFLWELAVVTGYSYEKISEWRRDGLPLVDGKITKTEAVEWRKAFVRSAPSQLREDSIEHLVPAILR